MFAAFLEAALDLDVLYLGVAISHLSILLYHPPMVTEEPATVNIGHHKNIY